jgi:6-pyruvoyltetrahydropterin/6-carboxytetrahydropterin synthase
LVTAAEPEPAEYPCPVLYRICKAFEIESGHMLSKHPDRCRYPHGHSRRVEVVLASPELDANDMVCDFAALKHALHRCLDRLDHAMAMNSEDPALKQLEGTGMRERVVVFQGVDPTTEVLAKHIYDYLVGEIAAGREYRGDRGQSYRLPQNIVVERVRVGETSTSWAEYGR